MSKITLGNLSGIKVYRRDDEYGSIAVEITTDESDTIVIECGSHGEDAEAVEHLLLKAHADAALLVADWIELPDYSGDGFIFSDYDDGYSVRLAGIPLYESGSSKRIATFPTKQIAMYELAAMQSREGVFPALWFEGPGSYGTFDIESDVRAFHDDGGTDLLPLEGVEYEDGQEALQRLTRVSDSPAPLARAGFGVFSDDWVRVYIKRDYGVLGFTWSYAGDDETHYSEHCERAGFKPAPIEEDE